MSNPFHGDVLFLDRPTSDRRRIKLGAPIDVHPRAVVLALTGDESQRVGHVLFGDWPDDHTLTVHGTVDLPPGKYPCGVQLQPMDVEPPPPDLSDDELVAWAFGDQAETVCVSGTVRGLAVYLGDDAESKPAWPGTHITVTAGATTP